MFGTLIMKKIVSHLLPLWSGISIGIKDSQVFDIYNKHKLEAIPVISLLVKGQNKNS